MLRLQRRLRRLKIQRHWFSGSDKSGEKAFVDARKSGGGGGGMRLTTLLISGAAGAAGGYYLWDEYMESKDSGEHVHIPTPADGLAQEMQEEEEGIAVPGVEAEAGAKTELSMSESTSVSDSADSSVIVEHRDYDGHVEADRASEDNVPSEDNEPAELAAAPAPTPVLQESESEHLRTQEKQQRVQVVDKPFDVSDVQLPVVAAEKSAAELRMSSNVASVDEIVMEIVDVHSDIEKHLLANLDQLDDAQLRVRLAQLTAEVMERSKWQSVRVNQAIRRLTADVSERYAKLMAQQRRELETATATLAIGVEEELLNKYSSELNRIRAQLDMETAKALKDQATALNTVALQTRQRLSAEIAHSINEKLRNDIVAMRMRHSERMIELLRDAKQSLADMEAGIRSAGPLGGTEAGMIDVDAHRRLDAILLVEAALGGRHDMMHALNQLKNAYKNDELTTSVVNSLPSDILNGSSPTTLQELKLRFPALRSEVIKATLAPKEAPSMVGYAIGSLLYLLSSERTGLVSGDGPEEILSRTSFYLERGLLSDAIREVNMLSGPGRNIAQDWIADARTRLICDQAIITLKSKSKGEA